MVIKYLCNFLKLNLSKILGAYVPLTVLSQQTPKDYYHEFVHSDTIKEWTKFTNTVIINNENNKREVRILYSIEKRIAITSADENSVAKISSLVEMMADCEQFQLDYEAGSTRKLMESGYGIFLVSRQMDIFRRPSYGKNVKCTTYIYQMNRAFGTRNTIITDENGEPIIKSNAIGAFVNLKTGNATTIDLSLFNEFEMPEKLDMEYLPRKIKLPEVAYRAELPSFCVPSRYLDYYGHVNNSKHIIQALDYITNEDNVKRIRIEYKTPMPKKADVLPYIYKQPEKTFIEFTGNNETYSVIEITGENL